MEAIAPTRFAEKWDNVGLLCGDPATKLTGVTLCIDLTTAVLDEAEAAGANAVVAYHPPIFKDLTRLTPTNPAGQAAYEAVRRGIAVFTPHTALDVAAGGTNDVLGDVLGMTTRRPLAPATAETIYKLVVYVPKDAVDQVAGAIFDAGAGRIGNYDQCSFRSSGTGTFCGDATTHPTIGRPGSLERVEEVRLETVVPSSVRSKGLSALGRAHPYEEPAFDLFQTDIGKATTGLGRIGTLGEPTSRQELYERIKTGLNVGNLLVCGPTHGEVSTVACCAGSCGDLLDRAAAAGAELYLTGELKHHDALRCQKLGMTAVCVLHSNSERRTLQVVADRLRERLPRLSAAPAKADRDPFVLL